MYQLKPDKHSSHSKILQLVGKNKKVLDIGCSSGYLAEIMQKKGCKVTGIDNDREALKEAKKFCTRTIYGDITKINLNKKLKDKFDVIVLGDIIEHVAEPEKLLSRIKTNIADNGYIIVSTGNIANIYARLHLLFGNFNYQEKGLFDKTHLRFFTHRTLKNLIVSSGYKIEIIEYAPIPIELKYPNMPASLFSLCKFSLLSLTKLAPKLFAFQFIIKAKIK